MKVVKKHGVDMVVTDKFYDDGAHFNKWKALEHAFDVVGRHGWLCNIDADVIWPALVQFPPLEIGKLYGAYRRMSLDSRVPDESEWEQLPLHRNLREFAGFTQIFHAEDPHLPPPPWHQVDWKHAGGADSFFQALWPPEDRIKALDVLHLGEPNRNWCGRATPLLDGREVKGSLKRRRLLKSYLKGRKLRKQQGLDLYEEEKLR